MRVIEFAAIVVAGIFVLTLFSVSQAYVQEGISESPHFQALGTTFRRGFDWAKNMSIIVYCLGAFMFYYLLFISKLVPRFISIWGLIGVILLFLEMILLTFGDSLRMILMMPIGLNELFLGIWLMVKGFDR